MNQVPKEKPILKKWKKNIISTKRATKKSTTIKKKHTKRIQQIKGKKPSKKNTIGKHIPNRIFRKRNEKNKLAA